MTRRDTDCLREALLEVGIERGDTLIVHVSSFLIEDTKLDEVPSRMYSAIRDIIGSDGTIIVPTFTPSFFRGKSFDLINSPSECSALSLEPSPDTFYEYVRQLPTANRTRDPIWSWSWDGPNDIFHDIVWYREQPGSVKILGVNDYFDKTFINATIRERDVTSDGCCKLAEISGYVRYMNPLGFWYNESRKVCMHQVPMSVLNSLRNKTSYRGAYIEYYDSELDPQFIEVCKFEEYRSNLVNEMKKYYSSIVNNSD